VDRAHVAEIDGLPGPDRDRLQFLDLPGQRIDRDDRHHRADADVARGADRIAVGQRRDDLIGRHLIGAEAVGIDADDHGPLVAAERRRGRHPRQTGEHRPDLEQRLVLDLADRLGLAGEDQVADRHATGVEPGDERRDGARRHERPRPVDVADGLGHRLCHVRVGVEEELHQGHALDVPRLDVVDAGDVEEVILVVVGEQSLHLCGVHAAVGLGHVDDREVEIGEDVDRHPEQGQPAAECDGRHQDHDGQRPTQGEDDRVHRTNAIVGVAPGGLRLIRSPSRLRTLDSRSQSYLY
jgi:hypothetical protein